jgi:hypothetical protein
MATHADHHQRHRRGFLRLRHIVPRRPDQGLNVVIPRHRPRAGVLFWALACSDDLHSLPNPA